MSPLFNGNQRETVKDMVLADYQVPKGVSIYKVFIIGIAFYFTVFFYFFFFNLHSGGWNQGQLDTAAT
jgi:hypothetical protein